MNIIDLTNEKIGLWTVVKQVPSPYTKSPSKPAYWKCKCKCGNIAIIPSHNLRAKKTLSCGCRTQLPEFKSLFNKLLWLSKQREIDCTLSFPEFKSFTKIGICHYCYSPIEWTSRGKSWTYHLDRKDNSIGYTKDNCVVCCNRCNWGKSSHYNYKEWYEMNQCFRKKQN